MGEKLAILDSGAQYGKVIDRRIRELNVESELLPLNTSSEKLKEYKAIIIPGGPESVYDENAPEFNPELFNLGIPILGICYGMHLINYTAGGQIKTKDIREDGQEYISVDISSKLFKGLSKTEKVLLTHGDSVEFVADGFELTAESDGIVAAIENEEKKIYGIQFHPEVDLTENGKQVFHNFLYNIAGFSGDYTMENREEIAIKYLKERVGDKKVLVLVSGGVDSTVLITLLNKALGPDRIYAIHIDNGYMRLNESQKVKKALEEQGLDLTVIEAQEDFYSATTIINGKETKPLRETTAPEEKRKIIGDTFMRVAEKAMRDLNLDWSEVYLAQGTLRPDLIESASALASGKADIIKTHHNDTELVRELRKKGRIIEPLKDYHKDEVRVLGSMLGLPDELVWRQPFPGPGLAVRILCADAPYITDDFDSINEKLKDFNTSNIFATLLPVRTVGVQGDGRSYSYLAALYGEKDWEELFRIAKEIPKKIHSINRIVYLFGDDIKEPVKEITETYPTEDVIKQLQQADDIVNNVLFEYDLMKKLSQVPVLSFPVNFGIPNARSIGIRTIVTKDFMTGYVARPGIDIPESALDKIVAKISTQVKPKVAKVAYDLAPKPPSTIEWE